MTGSTVLPTFHSQQSSPDPHHALAEEVAQCEQIQALEARLEPLKRRLRDHALYAAVTDVEELRFFMQHHVFAVWDFMSLLKKLQLALTCTSLPWTARGPRLARRLVNEIVLGEESDAVAGQFVSHLELYLDAMRMARAETARFDAFVRLLRPGHAEAESVAAALVRAEAPAAARRFVLTTFGFVNDRRVHVAAAAFTFGREDLIPVMFLSLLQELNRCLDGQLDLFVVYLERHIQLDGEDHGPMACKMLMELCGQDPRKWAEAADAAEQALQARCDLWDGVVAELKLRKLAQH